MSEVLVDRDLHETARRPTRLEVTAAGLLAASVILHLVAMIPPYYGGAGPTSLWSEPDQAAQYAVLAAGWALALGIALTGPGRARIGAAVAVGVAATEFGLRLSDLGEVFRYGTGEASAGLWLMTAAWAVGATGAGLAVAAVRWRDRLAGGSGPEYSAAPLDSAPTPPVTGVCDSSGALGGSGAGPESPTAPLSVPTGSSTVPLSVGPGAWTVADETGREAATLAFAVPDATASLPSGARLPESLGAAPAVLIVVLALATAGAFLPAWDHYTGTAATTGRSLSFNLGNAFSGPWQVVIGNVCVALALVAVPLFAVRMRVRAAGAALVAGALIVLASQFTAAIVQVDHHVPPSVAGLTPTQANQLGLQLQMSLTGWFTFDVLAAFALFVAAMVLGHVREVEVPATSIGAPPSVPKAGPPATLPWS
jgi:hypothetical protein